MTMRQARQRGVSLIEAIVALGVMAFGMLAVAGLQATLRSNGDLSKQRSEAVRIAQATVEDWRAFATMETTAGVVAYADLTSDAAPAAVPGVNATYSVQRTVAAAGSPPLKSLLVTVSWADRSGDNQSVQLGTTIAGVPPELAGSLAIPPSGALKFPGGRNRSIPPGAKDLSGEGQPVSVFMPPQAPGGTVAWVFNNLTGLITGVCNVAAGSTTNALHLAEVAACSANTTGQLLSGYVAFASTALQPNAAQARNPTGGALNLDVILALTSVNPAPPVCFDDASADPVVAAVPGTRIAYYCIVYSNAQLTWAGRSRIAPRAFNAALPWTIAANGVANYKVCRYTPLNNDVGADNADHPLDYTAAGSRPGASLTNQNFLVISAAHVCPADAVAAHDVIAANTRLHQDGSAAYDNP
jgi:Tfp pilus assembly protein PilV